MPLPESYQGRIAVDAGRRRRPRTTAGSAASTRIQQNFIAPVRRRARAVPGDLPGVHAPARAEEGLARRSRRAPSSARDVAERFGWKVGDRIPIQAHDLAAEGRRPDLGVQPGRHLRRRARRRQDAVLLPLRLPRREPRAGRGAGRLVRRQDRRSVAGAGDGARRSTRCSPTRRRRPRPTTEKAFVAGLRQADRRHRRDHDRRSWSAVLFTILLVAGNTMAQSVRERTSELAVLKTLGFSRRPRCSRWCWPSRCSSPSSAAALGLLVAWLIVLRWRSDRRLPADLHAAGAATSSSACC